MTARCSAPGKVMLFGEYAVLEGHPALALCLDRRIECAASEHDRLRVSAPGVFEDVDLDPATLDGPCPDARLALLWPVLRSHAPRGGVSLSFEAGFPPTWGLGSSSASTLAAAGALRVLVGAPWQVGGLFSEVLAAQRALQGAASGYDVAAQLLGGCVAYGTGGTDAADAQWSCSVPGAVSFSEGQWSCSVPQRGELRWVVAWTGRTASTGGTIRSVRARFPQGHAAYAGIGELSRRAVDAWVAGADLGPLLNEGHRRLADLGAVPEEADAIVRALQADPDVLGARMCGAGGGDSVLILAADPEYAGRAAEQHGLQILPLQPEAEGLRVEPSP